jgi:hypothetical protein
MAENKAKNALRDRGFRLEKARLASSKQTQDLLVSRFLIQCGFQFEILKRTPLSPRKKHLAPINRCTMLPNLRNKSGMRADQKTLQILQIFLSIPKILDGERQRPLDQVVVQVDSEEDEVGSDVELPPPPSVTSIDSIAENADFAAFNFQIIYGRQWSSIIHKNFQI